MRRKYRSGVLRPERGVLLSIRKVPGGGVSLLFLGRYRKFFRDDFPFGLHGSCLYGLRRKEVFRMQSQIRPSGGIDASCIGLDDQTAQIPKGIQASDAAGIRLEQPVDSSPAVGRFSQQNAQELPVGMDEGIDLKRGGVGERRKFHMYLDLTVVIPDFHPGKTTVAFFDILLIFIDVRYKPFIFRQNRHFLLGVFYDRICGEGSGYSCR